MDYDVHITRKTDWFADEGPAITLQEWLENVASDPDMRADGFAEAQLPDGTTLRIDYQGIAVWTAYPIYGEEGNMAWFCHHDDHITVKNPDDAIRIKMHHIATSFNGKVQGDEGEEYGADGRPVEAIDSSVTPPAVDKSWWHFWK